jgi:sialate O-acetylesterase
VPAPVAVRYAWERNPECNLCNREGLPASPFRSDAFVNFFTKDAGK